MIITTMAKTKDGLKIMRKTDSMTIDPFIQKTIRDYCIQNHINFSRLMEKIIADFLADNKIKIVEKLYY